MFDGDFVTVLFRLINFSVLIFLAIYLFKKYILESVKKNILLKKHELQALKKEQKELKKKYHDHERDIEQQAQLVRQLNDKVVQWHAVFDKDRKNRDGQRNRMSSLMRERVRMQSEYITRMYVRNDVVPQALEKAQIALEKEFDQKRAGDIVMKKIINSMKEHAA